MYDWCRDNVGRNGHVRELKMAKKDDVYIALIKFVKGETIETGMLSYGDCENYLTETYPELSARPLQALINDVTSRLEPPYGGSDQNQRKLRIESYFHLLEHFELEEARASSLKALQRSTIAIGVSILLALASIGTQLLVTADVKISEPIIVKMPHVHSY